MMNGRGRAALVIALIVLCSGLAGAAIDRVFLQQTMRHRGPPGRGGGGGGGRGGGGSGGSPEIDARRRGEMIDRMTRDLSLTDSQRAGIDSVMRRTDSALHAIRVEMNPRTAAVYEASRAEMSARLTDEQREKFEKSRGRSRR